MTRKPRTYYTDKQKELMWERWRKGDSITTVARLFDRTHNSISRIFREVGGFKPPTRKRSERVLCLSEREEISRGLAHQLSIRKIASQMSRSPSTISREINRNGGWALYRAVEADNEAWTRALRPKAYKVMV